MKFLPCFLLATFLAGTACLAEEPVAPVKPETTANFLKRMQPALGADEQAAKIKAELSKSNISRLKLNETPFQEAVKELNDAIRNHNAVEGAIQVPLLRVNESHFDKAGLHALDKVTIALSLSNIPLDEAIRYVTSLGGLTMDIKPDGLWLIPNSPAEGVLVHTVYYVPPSICSSNQAMEKWISGKDFPAIGLHSWHFDTKDHLLTLACGDICVPDFEKWYARKLLEHGFKPAGQK